MTTAPSCHPDRRHAGRGLCPRCYRRHYRQGTVIDLPRRTWAAEDLVAEAQTLRARHGGGPRPRGGQLRGVMPEGITWSEVAAQLGVTEKAIEKARARLRERTAS